MMILLPPLFSLAVQEEKILPIHRSAKEQLIHLDIILTLREEMIYVATACWIYLRRPTSIPWVLLDQMEKHKAYAEGVETQEGEEIQGGFSEEKQKLSENPETEKLPDPTEPTTTEIVVQGGIRLWEPQYQETSGKTAVVFETR